MLPYLAILHNVPYSMSPCQVLIRIKTQHGLMEHESIQGYAPFRATLHARPCSIQGHAPCKAMLHARPCSMQCSMQRPACSMTSEILHAGSCPIAHVGPCYMKGHATCRAMLDKEHAPWGGGRSAQIGKKHILPHLCART